MIRHKAAMFLPFVILIWILEVRALYHELSMGTFRPPADVRSGSLFGYSVAYQPNSKRLITSAPKFGTGVIYECNVVTLKCNKIEVNGTEGNKYGNMWLGATVATGQNFTMACAPRFTEWKSPKSNFTKLGTFGRCYAKSSGPKMFELATVEQEVLLQPYEKNMDSFGWSITVDRHNSIAVGGPAMHRGRVMLYPKSGDEPKLLQTPSYDKVNVKFNYGYSVTSGNFYSHDADAILYAISSPYGEVGHGMVIITDLSTYDALARPRWFRPNVGSLFGGALASASLRGPGQRQALLVAAPRYAEKGRVDVGAVYIYQFDLAIQKITHQKTILGKQDKGLFGSAVISLGDLNGDMRDEIAVSAPYEDGGRGAVYVYSGAHLVSDVADRMLQALQRIQPEGFRAFGLSLTALQDYDDNGCNKLAIGAPHSDNVAVLMCIAKIKVVVHSLQVQKRINDTYFSFQSCIDIKFPEKPKYVTADISLKISLSHKDAELAYAKDNNKFVEHKIEIRDKTSRHCVDVGIIIMKVFGYEPSIQYQITATQINSPIKNIKLDPAHVILSDLSVLSVSDTVWVADCAGASECKPQFSLEIQDTLKNGYVIGSSDAENVSFVAANSGDVAYKACAAVKLEGVRVGRWPSTCTLKEEVLYCLPRHPVENNTRWVSEQIELDTKSMKSDVKSIKVAITIYPHCLPNEIPSKSEKKFTLQPDHKGIILKGSSIDTIELTNEELIDTGKHTTHIYTVYNSGVTDWVNLSCEIGLEQKYFYKDISVSVDSQAPYHCQAFTNKSNLFTTTCVITELRKSHKFDVIIPIYIEPGTIGTDDLDNDNGGQITLSSSLKLIYGDKHDQRSIISKLKLKEAIVPIWIVIIAALVGLLIIIIIVFALYECGYLRRKNRDKLKKLRRSVHRQSVRRSMALRESMRSAASAERRSGDREKLIGENETNDNANKEKNTPITDIEPLQNTDSIDADSLKNESLEKEASFTSKDKCKIIKNDQIIRGLQKNLVQNRSLTHLAVTPKDAPLNTDM